MISKVFNVSCVPCTEDLTVGLRIWILIVGRGIDVILLFSDVVLTSLVCAGEMSRLFVWFISLTELFEKPLSMFWNADDWLFGMSKDFAWQCVKCGNVKRPLIWFWFGWLSGLGYIEPLPSKLWSKLEGAVHPNFDETLLPLEVVAAFRPVPNFWHVLNGSIPSRRRDEVSSTLTEAPLWTDLLRIDLTDPSSSGMDACILLRWLLNDFPPLLICSQL